MSYKLEKLLEERRIVKANVTSAMIERELKDADYDLGKANRSYEEADYKWATVQGYYSIFHSARALLYSKGYREKSHHALLTAVKELFVDEGTLESKYMDRFEDAMNLREEADYRSEFSEGGASETLESAEETLKKVKAILEHDA